MDIVSRLKDFLSYINIPSTQFADNCGIPRPSFSQLLSGRNKKVSNELIGKIHEAYPMLSILWLMFGQGDMLVENSMQFSQRQNAPDLGNSGDQSVDNQESDVEIDFSDSFTKKSSNNSEGASIDFSVANLEENMVSGDDSNVATPASDNFTKAKGENSGGKNVASPITLNPGSAKKIVNIIVYYSDNSFESFVPNYR